MSVVRGDAARRLMARSRNLSLPAAGGWSATMAATDGPELSDAACAFVTQELTAHDLLDRVPDATLVVRELVTNAGTHGHGRVGVAVGRRRDGLVLLEVSDEGPVLPRLSDATRLGTVSSAAPARPGSGLKLLSLLSQEWGVRRQGSGKTVWAVLHPHDDRCEGCLPL